MLKPITWNKDSFLMDGKPIFMISGEFPYYRVPKSDWRYRLELYKKAGGQCVSFYIPWVIHEPEEGQFFFGDTAIRDLEGFLQLCSEMELYAIARPGPYCYSEMIYGGLPEWLFKKYPEIMAKRHDGSDIHFTVVSYMHPVMLEKVKSWYDHVCPILAKYQLQKGGPIAFLQVDNELMGIHVWNNTFDFNPEAMGIGKEGGAYPTYLQQQYSTIGALNESYGTQFESFTAVLPIKDIPHQKRADIRRAKDYQDFYLHRMGEYVLTLTKWARDCGITCGITHNSGNPNMNTLYDPMGAMMQNQNFLLGSDHYYSLCMDWDNNPNPVYMSKIYCSLETLRHQGYPPTVFEMPSGSLADWPVLMPENLQCSYYLNLALGMKGLSYYIFTGGPNPNRIGVVSDSYDFQAPISADNQVRPHYYVQKEFAAFVGRYSWLTQASLISDVNVGLNREHARSERYFKGANEEGFANHEAFMMNRRTLLLTGMYSSYSPATIDLEDESLTQYTDKPLIVPVSVSMSKKIQNNLVNFIKAGGKLWLLPSMPYLDEQMEPCTILMDFLGAGKTRKPTRGFVRVDIGAVPNIWANESEWITETCPMDGTVLCDDEHNGEIIAWEKAYGNGLVIWTGIQWFHSQDEHVRLFRNLMKKMGVPDPVVVSDNASSIYGLVRSDGHHRMLFLMNLFSYEASTQIKVRNADGSYTDTGKHTLAPCSVKTFELL